MVCLQLTNEQETLDTRQSQHCELETVLLLQSVFVAVSLRVWLQLARFLMFLCIFANKEHDVGYNMYTLFTMTI
jgi:hypothetical protein